MFACYKEERKERQNTKYKFHFTFFFFFLQEKYLSEHNYDEQIDVDSTYKLLNFGDDYRNFIDSGPGSDFSDFAAGFTAGIQPNGKQKSSKRRLRRSVRTCYKLSKIYVVSPSCCSLLG